MKSIKIKLLFLILCFAIFSCKSEIKKAVSNNKDFTTVEKAILKSFDTLPTVNISLKDLGRNVDSITHKNFGNNYYCEDVRFNVWFKYNIDDSIKLSVIYFYDFDDCPISMTTKNGIYLLVNSIEEVYYTNKITHIDSVSNIAYDYYITMDNIGYVVEYKDGQSISILWDSQIKSDIFSKFINQIITGYFKFLNEKSIQIYNKELSKLNFAQSISLSSMYPFNLRIPNVEEVQIVKE